MTNVLTASLARAHVYRTDCVSGLAAGAGPSAEVRRKGNSNRDLGLLRRVAKGVK